MSTANRGAADKSAQRGKELGRGRGSAGRAPVRAPGAGGRGKEAPVPAATTAASSNVVGATTATAAQAAAPAAVLGVQVAGERERLAGQLQRDERPQGAGGLAGREGGQPAGNDSQG